MEIVNSTTYPHLAKFQIREVQKAARKKRDREIIEGFRGIHELEEEAIWELERLNDRK